MVLPDGRRLPGDLTRLLGGGPGTDGRTVDALLWIGRVGVLERLLRIPVEDTAGLLRIPAAAWRDERGRCFVAGCGGIRDALGGYLRARWGIDLGCLAEPEAAARGSPRGRAPRARTMSLEEAFEEQPPARNVVDAEWRQA